MRGASATAFWIAACKASGPNGDDNAGVAGEPDGSGTLHAPRQDRVLLFQLAEDGHEVLEQVAAGRHKRHAEARLDGHHVAPMLEACKTADFIVTATGCLDVVAALHIQHLKDGVVLANAGHFNNEISIPALTKAAKTTSTVRAGVTEYLTKDGRRLHLISDGRLVNLASGQGHPVEIMDMSFAIQALGMEHLVKNHKTMAAAVHDIPAEIDAEVAKLRLATWGLATDTLTKSQRDYLTSWEHGT